MAYWTIFPNFKIDMTKRTFDELGFIIVIFTTYNLITSSPK
jgi:hypothetical protein